MSINPNFDLSKFDVEKFDSILARGLSRGLGEAGGQVCIEAAICETLGLEHSDDPGCVGESPRVFKICLNDASGWVSPKSRANALRDVGIAQVGSKGVVDDVEFSKRLAEKTIRILIPKLFREVFADNPACLAAAERCEKEGSKEAAAAAAEAAEAARGAAWAAARGAAEAAWAAAWAAARGAETAETAAAWAEAAAEAARAAGESYLILSAELALEVLRELKSPGVELLDKENA